LASSRSGLCSDTGSVNTQIHCLYWMCHSRTYVYQDLAEDENDQVLSAVQIVEGSVFPQSIAGRKQHCTERVQSDQLEAFVVTDRECQEV